MKQSKTQAFKILRYNQWHELFNKLSTEINTDDINTLYELQESNDMTRLKIKETAYFKALSPMLRTMYGKSKMLYELVRAYNITKMGKGSDLDLNNVQRGIVDELLNICDCGLKIDESYDPCCSLTCWIKKFE